MPLQGWLELDADDPLIRLSRDLEGAMRCEFDRASGKVTVSFLLGGAWRSVEYRAPPLFDELSRSDNETLGVILRRYFEEGTMSYYQLAIHPYNRITRTQRELEELSAEMMRDVYERRLVQPLYVVPNNPRDSLFCANLRSLLASRGVGDVGEAVSMYYLRDVVVSEGSMRFSESDEVSIMAEDRERAVRGLVLDGMLRTYAAFRLAREGERGVLRHRVRVMVWRHRDPPDPLTVILLSLKLGKEFGKMPARALGVAFASFPGHEDAVSRYFSRHAPEHERDASEGQRAEQLLKEAAGSHDAAASRTLRFTDPFVNTARGRPEFEDEGLGEQDVPSRTARTGQAAPPAVTPEPEPVRPQPSFEPSAARFDPSEAFARIGLPLAYNYPISPDHSVTTTLLDLLPRRSSRLDLEYLRREAPGVATRLRELLGDRWEGELERRLRDRVVIAYRHVGRPIELHGHRFTPTLSACPGAIFGTHRHLGTELMLCPYCSSNSPLVKVDYCLGCGRVAFMCRCGFPALPLVLLDAGPDPQNVSPK